MSVNLHLSVEVRGYDPAKADDIIDAIVGILDREGLTHDFGQFEYTQGADGQHLLRTRTNPQMPVIISKSYVWIPKMTERLEAAVHQANGGACEVRFSGDDADGGTQSESSHLAGWRPLTSQDDRDEPGAASISRVERHVIKAALLDELLPKDRLKLEGRLAGPGPTNIRELVVIADIGERVLQYCSVIERNDPAIHLAVRSVAQSASGTLVLSSGTNGHEVEILLGDRKIVMGCDSPNGSGDIIRWKDGWYAALAARDEECLELLSGIPDNAMKAAGNFDSYHYSWKEALVAFRSDPQSALPHIESAIKLSQPERTLRGHPSAVAAQHAIFPMLSSLVRMEADTFNQRLVAALKAHRNFWKSQGPKGWIAWGPLALCCLAHDCGIPVEVESDYLLPILINRR